MVSRTLPRLAGMVNKANTTPYYQRFYQHSNKRLWHRPPYSKYYLRPYIITLWGTAAAVSYALIRTVLGHRTWY